jgi:hypothetical protein
VFLHEAGHAVFDILQVPLFGREEDAADQFSLYIMLKMEKDEARRLILGTAYQYKGDVQSPIVSMPQKKFADEHGTPSQRYFNVLCLAYGADKELFADFVSKGLLPKERAEGCKDEYAEVAFAFDRLITPSIDRKLASKLRKRWLLPADTRPKKRVGVAGRPISKVIRGRNDDVVRTAASERSDAAIRSNAVTAGGG